MAAQTTQNASNGESSAIACSFPGVRAMTSQVMRPMALRVNLSGLQEFEKGVLAPEDVACALRAAWGLVLQYYIAAEEVCFGYEECPGETRAIRMSFDAGMTFGEAMRKMKGESVLPAQDANDVVNDQGKGDAQQTSSALFDTAVVLRVKSRLGGGASTGTSSGAPHVALALPKNYKLRVLAKQLDKSLSVFLEWWHPTISQSFAANIAELYTDALNALFNKPELKVADHRSLTDRDRQKILEWNRGLPEVVDRCIHEVIHDQLVTNPDSESVCAWDGSLTRFQLDELSSQLALQLVELGIGPEARVALCFEKSKWNIVAMVAVLKAGGTFVPLDPTHPTSRLQNLVNAVDAQILLCSRSHVANLTEIANIVLPVDEDTILPSPATLKRENLDRHRAKPDNAAYILFTSGSTGEPKGTLIEHRAFCSGVKAHAPAMLFDAESRVLQFAAHTFDASIVETLTTLMVGACVCVPSEESRLNDIVGAMNGMRVNHAVLTPSFINFVEPSAVPALKTLVLAGEAMSQSHVDKWSQIRLVNGYGPTEASVAAVVNSKVTRGSDSKDIGLPVGTRCWVVDSENADELLPIGCTGELLLEGPTLARCYLNDPTKTAEAFICDPAWTKDFGSDETVTGPRRFYKTGDLVRYNSDSGSFNFVGRKDTQVKFHGQRIELGEIEHHLVIDPVVKHGLILLPKIGHFSNKLVAVLSLKEDLLESSVEHSTALKLLPQPSNNTYINGVRERMSSQLPGYMVPSTWLCVEALPFLSSRKLDRKTVSKWLEKMDGDDVEANIAQSSVSEEENNGTWTATELQLREVWSRVLNVPMKRIACEQSFLNLGGDSITAMTCMNQCKKRGIGVTVQEVLRSKSIRALAECAKVVKQHSAYTEAVDQPFDLSPIQELHFHARDDNMGHFNQSFFLRLNAPTEEDVLKKAIEILLSRHSMLRARFSYSDTDNKWQQRVTSDTHSSYRFHVHTVDTQEEMKALIADTQSSLNAVSGPVLGVDLFNLEKEQFLAMMGHHLVIDLVSWRVILEELEELLINVETSTLPPPTMPFQSWCLAQAEHCREVDKQNIFNKSVDPAGNFSYWGMQDQRNVYGEVACHGFEISPEVTSLLLTQCNQPLGTEIVDILIAALAFSFANTFTDRAPPVIHNEGHGREVWDLSFDISRTVGWFTIIYPIIVSSEALNEIVETLIRVKDIRRRVTDNGRAYFAHSVLTGQNKTSYENMEVTFNYLGRYQQLERQDALFQPVEGLAGETSQGGGAADFGRETPRFGLFEISAVVAQDALRFSFSFNGSMKHQESIRRWISSCQDILIRLSEQLPQISRHPTLSDFPLMSFNYDELRNLSTGGLSRFGVKSLNEVEDIYPCSPMQQGLILSQTRDQSFYAVRGTWQVDALDGGLVDVEKLAQSWQQVVDRHGMLRTVFAEDLSSSDLYSQIVLKTYYAQPQIFTCNDETEVLKLLEDKLMIYREDRPAHQFTICRTTAGKVFCRLELSHTIMDGASISIILRDLEVAYAALPTESVNPLFSGFISHLQKQPKDQSIQFWKCYLSDIEPCHFPALNDGRVVEREYRTLRVDFRKFAQLQGLCERKGFTVANALHAAWSLTLRCYTTSDEVCFGYLLSERDAPVNKIEDAVGPMINMLACRVNMPGDSSLVQVVERIQEDYMQSLPYKHTSLAEVQHALGLSDTALFNTCFSYRKLPSPMNDRQPSIEFTEFVQIHDPTEYLITANVEATDRDAAIDIDYWTDTMSDEQASNIASTFLKALHNLIDHSEEKIGELNLVSEEQIQLINEWNSFMPPAIEKCIHDVVHEQAFLRPLAPAICSWDASVTYEQLDDLSSRFANYLIGLGVVSESFVALCFEKSAWTMVAMLAVLKAGGGCVPLDAGHPKSALEVRVLETNADVVLASPSCAHILEDVVPYVVPVDEAFLNELPQNTSDLELCIAQPSNPAFVIFTSGSTGKPKGVVLEHRALVTSAEVHGAALGVSHETRFLQFASYSFDNSLEEMFTTLMRGGCVCVPSEHDRLNNLVKAMNELNVTFTDMTASVAAFIKPEDVPSLKGLAIGGEAPTKEIRDTWTKAVRVQNIYGPTECSINCAHNPDISKSSDITNIGRSIGSVSWIVNASDHNSLVPVGCVGELLIEGPILARGYLNNPGKTDEAFIKNPAWTRLFPPTAGNKPEERRMYKTGDLVRYNSDGSITYFGRKDTQVKLNGQRIELGEIEHNISISLPSGSQSAVELVKAKIAGRDRKALVGFICLQFDGQVPDASVQDVILPVTDSFQAVTAELKASLSSSLQAYMVPNLYMPVLRMPFTSSGKLNRRMLRTLAEKALQEDAAMYRLGGKSGRTPSTPAEKALQALWATVLGVEASLISADDTFFRHGGDSIGAIKLVTSARHEGYSLSVSSILQSPKLCDMARNLSGYDASALGNLRNGPLEPFSLLSSEISLDELREDVANICQISVDLIEDLYPCSPLQEGLVALSSREPGSYVTQNVYKLPEEIDVEKFQKAWQVVADSEAILRTRVVHTKDYGFLQVVVREPLVWHTAESLDSIECADRYLPPHNGGILSRYAIVEKGSQQPLFIWTAHHAMYDGWSLPILLEKVQAAYSQSVELQKERPCAYSHFIQYLSAIDNVSAENFWKEHLSGITPSNFPPVTGSSYNVSPKGQLARTVLLPKLTGMYVTLPSVVRAAWAFTVSVYSGCDDIIFGEILTGRDAPIAGITELVGPALTTVPMRVQIDKSLKVATFLEKVQAQAASVMPYQYSGLQNIMKLSEDAKMACDFRNLLAITHDNEPDSTFWDLVSVSSGVKNFFTYPLTLSCTIQSGRVEIQTYYDENLISTTQLQRVLTQFDSFLQVLSSSNNADEILGQMNLMHKDDMDTVKTWNAQPLETVDRCVHDLIEEKVADQPNAEAVCSWDSNFSYQELSDHSTKLAAYLQELGVTPGSDTFVPICFEKSAFVVVAILAILKAGGAFVPLDPKHPIARLQEIIGNLEAKVMLCSAQYESLCGGICDRAVKVNLDLLTHLGTPMKKKWTSKTNSPAYAIFTSGTTGKPKGCVIEHRAFCSGAKKHAPAFLIRPNCRFLQFASYTFDASVIEILTALIMGGCVCIPDENTRLNGIAKFMTDNRVDSALLTPSMAQMIDPTDVPTLRTLILGGEAMSARHLSTWANHVDLVNGYGPTECSVVAAANAYMAADANPTNIGQPVGTAWLVDPNNHDRLVPVGATGELLIEGPTLARGYLKNNQKTSEVFIENPRWVQSGVPSSSGPGRRMYKTGDLVKYAPDNSGDIIYIGRKDNQAKLHGQRLELEEVEHHLSTDPEVRHALVTIPKGGNCVKRLVAVISLQKLKHHGPRDLDLELLDPEESKGIISAIQQRLRDRLPAYMVPAVWVVLRGLPLLPSGKLNRRQTEKYVTEISDEAYQQVMALGCETSNTSTEMTDIERRLREIWAAVLNLPVENIGLNSSFLHLGGDSMSAMSVMSRCRSAEMSVTVQDIITCKSIPHLALLVKLPQKTSYEEKIEQSFQLSPIQQLYFQCMGGNANHFNQSILVEMEMTLEAAKIRKAINTLVNTHSMLRSRFSQDEKGVWTQRITEHTEQSYKFAEHKLYEGSELANVIQDSQKNLDVVNGPIIRFDLFKLPAGKSQLCICIHHLVVDVVSWGIILQDLEDLLRDGKLQVTPTMSFQNWCNLQLKQAQSQSSNIVLPFEDAPKVDFDFWGMKGKANCHGDTITENLQLDEVTTSQILASCSAHPHVDLVDILLGILLISFSRVFADRKSLPTIFNESHGREPWDADIDISRTLGWFTAMSPIYLPKNHTLREDNDILKCVTWIADLRKRTPGKGRPYFASRMLTADGNEKFGSHWPMEIAFNYVGQHTSSETTEKLLRPVEGTGQSINSLSDIGTDVPRFALIEIGAIISQGKLSMSFSYNKNMRRQNGVQRWAVDCKDLINDVIANLGVYQKELSSERFPLLPLAYNGMAKLKEKLMKSGMTSWDNIEDIYPCSPMQQGILLSQLKDPETYAYRSIFELRSRQNTVDADGLSEAWQTVVQHHSTLRTIFIDSCHESSLMDQVVMKKAKGRVVLLTSQDENVVTELSNLENLNCQDGEPPHRLAICHTTSGRIFCRLDISHALGDGTSMPLLLRDLCRAYTRDVSMSVSRPWYSEFIRHLQSISKEKGVAFWKNYLSGSEPCYFPSLLGTDPGEKSLGSHILKLSRSKDMQLFCQKSSLTASNLLQLVWGMVLRCYTGAEEVCFGYLSSGRDIPVEGIQDAVGAFINMLICRLELREDLVLNEALKKTQLDYVNSMEYQSTSLAEVQHELGLSDSVLFNTVFTFQRRRGLEENRESALDLDILTSHDPSEYKIAVNVEVSDSSTEIHFSYWKDHVSPFHIEYIADTFEQAVNEIINSKDPQQTVGQLSFFGPHSCQKVRDWNATPATKVNRCMHEMIEEQTRLRPESTSAICGWDASFTYKELDAVSSRLAGYLMQQGVGPEVYVPLCFEKSAWTIVAQIAVMKAGGAYVALDPSHPESRLQSLIDDIGATILLTSTQYFNKVSSVFGNVVIVNKDTIDMLPRDPVRSNPNVKPSDPAYVIFTSGSTGKPKGTVLEHAAYCSSALAHSVDFSMSASSRAFQFASYTFDASLLEIMSILIVGGCVCVPSDHERMNDIPGAMTRMNANWSFMTPSVANTLKPESLPTLETLAMGGEKMAPGHIDRWGKTTKLINAYGPTECCAIAVTGVKSNRNGEIVNNDPGTIGRPSGHRAWIVSPRNPTQLVPVGAVGEMIIDGPIVGRGYLNNEKKTNEVFLRNPELTKTRGLESLFEQSERMYRTGDLCRYNPDGSITYLSRLDTQVKINGQRVELGEIEFQCRQLLPEGTQAAVELISINSNSASKKLALFFTAQDTEVEYVEPENILQAMTPHIQGLAKDMEKALANVLPTYMIPKHFIPVANMPWTSGGKIDRRKIKTALETLPTDIFKSYSLSNAVSKVLPKSESEEVLVALWAEVLSLPNGSIGVDDNFFGLGGDSLAAMRLVGLAAYQDVTITAVDIFRSPVLKDMARTCTITNSTIQKKGKGTQLETFSLLPTREPLEQIINEVVEQCDIEKDLIEDIYPCSPLQEGLITLSMKQKGAYVAQNVLQLSPKVDVSRLKLVLQQVVDELDILRTRIVHTAAADYVQVVLKDSPITWQEASDLKDVSGETMQIPEKEGGLLTRYTIIPSVGSKPGFFVWSIHHALYDGWGLGIIMKRIEDLYLERESMALRSPYASFIQYLGDRDIESSDDFWRSYLEGSSVPSFPSVSDSLVDHEPRMETCDGCVDLPQDMSSLSMTIPMLIRAAWAIIIASYTSSEDVVFGETLTGRNIDVQGITDVAGPVLTTVPMRIQLDGQQKLADYLRSIRMLSTEMIDHQHSGLQHIRRLGPDAAAACSFRNLLIVQNSDSSTNDDLWEVCESGTVKNFFTYPLVAECRVSGLKVDFVMYYDEKIISGWQIERIIYQFSHVLRQFSPSNGSELRALSSINAFSPEDKEEVAWWNRRIPRSVGSCVHELFKEKALCQPEAPAVCAWDGEVTYDELKFYGSKLASYLTLNGVGPEQLVPICMDKSVWAIVAIMGVLMSGAAFVPLDPTHPMSRHKEIFDELGAKTVLYSPKHASRYESSLPHAVQIDEKKLKEITADTLYPELHKQTAKPNDLAYAIFTSGSTGRAKGITIEHQAFSSASIAFAPAMHMMSDARVLQFASLSFDAAVMEILSTLINGGCVCVPSEEERLKDISASIRRMNVTWSLLTPSVANLIDPESVPCLKVLVCGGEAMSPETIRTWKDKVVLINAYGPSEASVVATVNAQVTSESAGSIGWGITPTLTWVTNPDDHNLLSPVGTVGELCLEGPSLARGYLKDPQKTSLSFVKDPRWASEFPNRSPCSRIIHKTGDLVRYNADGSLNYVGRKDNQVKLHGQRMDLGEIQHRLDLDPFIKHVIVLMPKKGPFKMKLIAVLSLNDLNTGDAALLSRKCELISKEHREERADGQVAEIKNRLSRQLPAYMVPSAWAVIKGLPMLVSGKLDRKNIQGWVEQISEDVYRQITGLSEDNNAQEITGDLEGILQDVISQVLNLPKQKINLNLSFLSLGGDSISAMAVVSRCRKQKVNLSLPDVLRSESIRHLASTASGALQVMRFEEKENTKFSLSPIQNLYFLNSKMHTGNARFNQSFSVRLSRRFDSQTIQSAIHSIVQHHSMLRARFSLSKDGNWEQMISSDTGSSYTYRTVKIDQEKEYFSIVGESQASLDIQKGPIFVANLMDVNGKYQVLSLVAHHLCVDVVSWRIVLQDLEEILESGSLTSEKGLPFQAWVTSQAQKSKVNTTTKALPFQVIPPNLDFWGMRYAPNIYGDVDNEAFALDEAMSDSIMNTCHQALRTEPLDILLASVIHSFRRTFPNRHLPTIFNEGHGRDVAEEDIDLSRTVGWFTNIAPIYVKLESDNVLDTLRMVKDTRRKSAVAGRNYFTKRFQAPVGGKSLAPSDVPMEIMFNFLGSMQQMANDDSLFQSVDLDADSQVAVNAGDLGPEASRLALFEISAMVSHGKVQFSFMFNRRMNHMDDIKRWITECKWALEETVVRLRRCEIQPTLSDYPLLPVNYQELRRLFKEGFPKVGIKNRDEVEDIYPCSPTQEGILLGQLRDPKTYLFHIIFEIKHRKSGVEVDVERLINAWQQVVDRHAALRTTFVHSPYKGGAFDQLVIKHVPHGAIKFECDDSEALSKLQAVSLFEINKQRTPTLPHQITICKTSTGRILLKMEINHAVIDGGSTPILLRDIIMAYEGQLPSGNRPLYSEYIHFIRSQSPKDDIRYWRNYLNGITLCHFPPMSKPSEGERGLSSIRMQFDRWQELQIYCEATGVTLANVVQAAWAVVLRLYTKSDDVCFGYLTAGREAPVKGIQDAMGVFINMLCCRVQFTSSQLLAEVPKKIQNDYLNAMPHQRGSLAQVQHDLGLQGKQLFNTALSIQNHTKSKEEEEEESLIFENQTAHDPSEYAITLNIETARADEGVVFRYWTDIFSATDMGNVSRALSDVLATFITEPQEIVSRLQIQAASSSQPVDEQTMSGLEHVSDEDTLELLLKRNPKLQSMIDNRVKKLVEEAFRLSNLQADSPLAPDINIQDLEGDTPEQGTEEEDSANDSANDSDDSFKLDNGRVSARPRQHIGRRGALEQKLLQLWSAKLGVAPDSISKDDSFFERGGDSITAMSLVGDAREEGLHLTVADVFQNPVFADMAAIVQLVSELSSYAIQTGLRQLQSSNFSDLPKSTSEVYQRFGLLKVANMDELFLQKYICPQVGVFKGGISDVLPLTDFQALAVTGALLDSRWMLNYFYFDGQGSLDLRRLKQSCFRVVHAFDILRSVFVSSKDRFVQVILRKMRPEFLVHETEDSMDSFTEELQRRDQLQSLRQGEPFVQFMVVQDKNSDRHRILMRLSHAQYDGVCLPKILSAIKAGYEGGPIPSTPSFAGYVRESAGTVTAGHYEHWRKLLRNSRMTEIVHRNGPNYNTSAGATTAILRKSIHLSSIAHGNITTATVIKAAWALTLARICGTSDVVFGHTISGRNAAIPGVESMVGPCVNIVPIRVSFQEGWTALELLRFIQDQQVANMPYEALGFRQIIKHCTDWPKWTNFTTTVQHQNVGRQTKMQLGDNEYRVAGVGSDEEFSDLSIVSTPLEADKLEIAISFSLHSAVNEALAQKMLDMVCDTAEDFAVDPGMIIPPPSTLDSLPKQTIEDISKVDDDDFIKSQLQTISASASEELCDLIGRLWRQVLVDADGNAPLIKLNSSFFDLGGDIVSLAQVVCLLEQEGSKVRLNDLLAHPTLRGQMAVVVKSHPEALRVKGLSASAGLGHDSSTPTALSVLANAVDPSLEIRPKVPRTKSWATAFGLARNLVRKEARRRQVRS